MRILFISDAAYPFVTGGVEALESKYAIELSKHHKVDFLCIQWDGMKKDFYRGNIHYSTMFPSTINKFYHKHHRSIRMSAKYSIYNFLIFSKSYDVIIANAFPFINLPILRLYCILHRCKLIIDVAEVWKKDYWIEYIGKFKGRLGFSYMKWALSMGDCYISNSSETSSRLIEIGLNNNKITEFAPSVNITNISKIKFGGYKQDIIFSGRLIKEKNVDMLIDLCVLVKKDMPDLKVEIIGMGYEKDKLEARVARLGLSENIIIRDFYSEKKDLYSDIKDSKVMVNMSEREGLGIITIESLSLGTPVVLPDYSPIPKEIKDLCIVSSVNDMKEKLKDILSNPDSYRFSDFQSLKKFDEALINSTMDKIFNELELAGK